MRNRLFSLVAVFAAAFVLVACFDDEKDDASNGYDETAITLFSVESINVPKDTLTKAGADTVVISALKPKKYKFYIDQITGTVYNPDSLPYGADATKVIVSVTNKNGGRVFIKSTTDESFTAFSTKDSIDFSQPRIFRTYTVNGAAYRDYTVKVNVHKEKGDDFVWNSLGTQTALVALSAKKAFVDNGRIYVFGVKSGRTYGYYSSETDGQTWTEITTTFAQDAYKSVVAQNGVLYLVDNQQLMSSTDAQTWQAIGSESLATLLGSCETELYGLTTSGDVKVSTDGGLTWNAETFDADVAKFPTSNVSYTVHSLKTNTNITQIMLAGEVSGTQKTNVWTKMVDKQATATYKWSFVEVETGLVLPAMPNLHLIRYDGKDLALGTDSNASKGVVVSADGGITWKRNTLYPYPLNFTASTSFAAAVDSNHFIWIFNGGNVWKGRLTRLGWASSQKEFMR